MGAKKRKLTEEELTGLVLHHVLTLGAQGKLTGEQAHAVLDTQLKERRKRERRRKG
jgi:hypothetical protein